MSLNLPEKLNLLNLVLLRLNVRPASQISLSLPLIILLWWLIVFIWLKEYYVIITESNRYLVRSVYVNEGNVMVLF